jgi:ribonuclease Y
LLIVEQKTKYQNMEPVSIIIGAAVGLVLGGGLVWVILNGILKGKRAEIIREAEKEGENIKKDKILQAKERFLQLKEEHEKAVIERAQSAKWRRPNQE